MTRMTTISRLVAAMMILTAGSAAVAQELDDRCTVSVLNRNAQVKPDGTWILPIIPAGFGPVRARATCVRDNVTRSGESQIFVVPANGSVDVPAIQLGSTTPIPDVLTLTTLTPTLRTAGATAQITAVASYRDGSTRNVTNASTGTVYTISNPAIASIAANGLVSAAASGTALVQATNEGASGLLSISVILTADSDGDGILDDIELREGLNPNNPADALEDFDRDSLSNLDEVRAGTQLRNADSDGDTIGDGEEVRLGADGFVTNPLLADTDGDGVRDALEIASGSNPTDPASINLAGALARIELLPPAFRLTVNTINPEASTQLSVRGNLRDGTTIDLTSTSRGTSYSSSDLNVCNFSGVDGRVHASAEGTCTITALSNGFSAAATGVVRNFTPIPLASVSIPGFANNVDVSEDYAYVAAGAAGLSVVNVSNPRAPTVVTTVDTPGNANDIRIVDRYAYLADGPAGLKIFDVVNPEQPVLIGSVQTPGEANDVMVVDNLVYVAAGPAGLVIVNGANPSAPVIAGQFDTPGYSRGVDVAGSVALIADDNVPALVLINVTNPASPSLLGSLALGGNPKDVRARDNVAYVSAYTGGLHAVNFSNPAAPIRVGGVSGQFYPFDAELADRFVLAADVLFTNALPISFLQTPDNPIFRGTINFSQFGDQNGTGVAVSGPYVFMTGALSVITDNGTTGSTSLFIGQFLPEQDLAGIPPQVEITSPALGETHYEGSTVTVRATATDDVAISHVTFSVGGQVVFTDTAAPYEYVLQIPFGTTSMTVSALAADLAGNSATDTLTFPVTLDPLTTVSGIVVNEQGVPLVGATVTTLENRSATTGTGGVFSIFNVPSFRGNIVVTARYVGTDGIELSGSSAPKVPVPAGVTDVGTISVLSAQWEPNFGTLTPRCDDCSFSFALPFAFPYYNSTFNSLFVGTNGYVTFDGGDTQYVDSVFWFNGRSRIAVFFDDLDPRGGGGLWVNSTLPGRFVVTWDRVPHYPFTGSNTIQMILYATGRIQFGYRGLTSTRDGAIVGINPRPSSPLMQVNYNSQAGFSLPADTGIYEYFSSLNPFDLDFGFILFDRQNDGGYSVRTIVPPPAGSALSITGGPAPAGPGATGAEYEVQGNAFGHAEVEVLSSGNVSYRGLTNTNGSGRFSLNGVPAGAISVTVRKKDRIIGQGAIVARGQSDPRDVEIKHPNKEKKSSSQ